MSSDNPHPNIQADQASPEGEPGMVSVIMPAGVASQLLQSNVSSCLSTVSPASRARIARRRTIPIEDTLYAVDAIQLGTAEGRDRATALLEQGECRDGRVFRRIEAYHTSTVLPGRCALLTVSLGCLPMVYLGPSPTVSSMIA